MCLIQIRIAYQIHFFKASEENIKILYRYCPNWIVYCPSTCLVLDTSPPFLFTDSSAWVLNLMALWDSARFLSRCSSLSALAALLSLSDSCPEAILRNVGYNSFIFILKYTKITSAYDQTIMTKLSFDLYRIMFHFSRL